MTADELLDEFEWAVARWKGTELVDRFADMKRWCAECLAWVTTRHEVEVAEVVMLCPRWPGCERAAEVEPVITYDG